MNKHYAAIILAAGFSSRMGDFKPLLPLGEQTVADRVISVFQENDIDVILVGGYHYKELVSGIKSRNITLIENPDYKQGMFTSIQAGVRNLKPHYKAFFVMPVDIPLVRPATIVRLLKERNEHPNKITYPVFGSKRGHPPLLPYCLASVISKQPESSNLGTILKTWEGMALEVKVPDSHILFNLNIPDDYKILLDNFQRYDVPTEAECISIMNDICKTPLHVQRHCSKVAEVAVKIGKALDLAGKKVDLQVIRAAASLHDIAKGQPKHDIAGGRVLRNFGFGRIGDIVAAHTDLPGGETEIGLEAKVVYLADKLAEGDRLVSIEERYQSTIKCHPMTPDTEQKRLLCKQRAIRIKQGIEALVGCSIEQIIFQ